MYMPVLKAKGGELSALRSATQSALSPLIEIPPPTGTKSAEDALKKMATDLADAWRHEIHVDVAPFVRAVGEVLPSGSHVLDILHAELSRHGIMMIPVTSVGAATTFQAAVARVAAASGRGAALRLQGTDLDRPTTILAYATAAATAIGLASSDIDLIADVAVITTLNSAGRVTAVTNTLTALSGARWHGCFVISGGYPGNPTGVAIGSVSHLRRADWDFWVAGRGGFGMPSIYGDYGVDAPTFPATGGRAYSNLKYTTTAEWLFVRGENVTSPGGYAVFNSNCRIIKARPEYSGAAFSMGDTYIDSKCAMSASTGNATQWRAAMYSHHIAMVVDQLTGLGAPVPRRRGPPAPPMTPAAKPTAKKSRGLSARKSKS